MTDLEALARELWEAHATHHQAAVPFPQQHWDDLDPFTRDHWLHLARTAETFRSSGQRRALKLLAAILSRADMTALGAGVAYATLEVPFELLDEAFAVTAAVGA